MGDWAEIMRGIPDDQLRDASAIFQTADFNHGDPLLDQGTEDPVMIYLLSGGASVVRDEIPVFEAGPGDILGISSMIGRKPRSAAATAVGSTRALLLDLEGYEKLVASGNPVIYRIERVAVQQQATRLRHLNALVRDRSSGEKDGYRRPGKGFLAAIRKMVGDSTVTPTARPLDAPAILAKSSIFAGEDPDVLAAIAPVWEPVVFGLGDTLCEQGKQADGLYLVGLGDADVYVALPDGKIHKLGSVHPGDAVGMTAMLDGQPRGATVIATEQVDALRLSKARFDDLMVEESAGASGLRRAVLRGFADQVAEAGLGVVQVTPKPEPVDEDEVVLDEKPAYLD